MSPTELATVKLQCDAIAEGLVSPLEKFKHWKKWTPSERRTYLKSLWAFYERIPPEVMALFLEELASMITRRMVTRPKRRS